MLTTLARFRCFTSVGRTVSLQKAAVRKQPCLRSYSDKPPGPQVNAKDQVKVRRAYVMGGCLAFIWLGTHGILLYRRRSEFRQLNEKIPPIEWEEFVNNFLSLGEVKTIVFQPQFGIGNVYLVNAIEQQMKKTIVDWFHSTPDKFSRPPDVRVYFDGDQKQLEQAVLTVQKGMSESGAVMKDVELSIDQFPSYRELSFIAISTLFTLAAVTLMK